MKKQILIQVLMIIAFSHLIYGQQSTAAEKPFKPYISFEVSSGSALVGSLGSMERMMKSSGYGGTYTTTDFFWFFTWTNTTTYPIQSKNPAQGITMRYQFKPAHGVSLTYGLVEDYRLTGHLFNGGTFTIHNKMSSASASYTLSTINQRFKAGAGLSYSWMKSGTESYAGTENTQTSGAIGLNLNMAFTFLRVKPFYLSYKMDANITGSLAVGPYQAGTKNWQPGKLPVSTISQGLTLGVNF